MSAAPCPALFLDRDGTLIEEADYLADPAGVIPVPGAVETLRRFREAGWYTVVVTNQSGIARGRFTEADYQAVTRRLEALLADGGVALDLVLHCPHLPEITGPCACRKPAPGMLLEAAHRLGIDLSRSLMVGDKHADLAAGVAAGVRPVLVRTGYGTQTEAAGGLPPTTRVVDSVADLSPEADGAAGTARPAR